MCLRYTVITGLLLACWTLAHAQDQTGTILFYRESHFATGDFKPALFCGGVELAQIENGTYFQVTAPAGLHSCTIETSQRPAIEVSVTERKVAYVHVQLQSGWKDRALLRNTTEDEYVKRQAKLKPLKEWSRTSIGTAQSPENSSPTEASSHAGSRVKGKHSGKFGDLSVSVSKLVMTPSKYAKNRGELEAFVSVENTGKGVIRAEFNVTLKTTFDLQYSGTSMHAPKMREMLPGESAEGSYIFDIKDGVQPLELVIALKSKTYVGLSSAGSIRCGSEMPFHDVFVSDEVHINVRDIPVVPNSPE